MSPQVERKGVVWCWMEETFLVCWNEEAVGVEKFDASLFDVVSGQKKNFQWKFYATDVDNGQKMEKKVKKGIEAWNISRAFLFKQKVTDILYPLQRKLLAFNNSVVKHF